MRHVSQLLFLAVALGVLAAAGTAEQPKEKPADPPKTGSRDRSADTYYVVAFVSKMMAFDKNKDGKLTRDEITDERLLRLFDQADTNKDGVVTKEELTALATKMLADEGAGGGRRGGPAGEGPGGPNGPGGRGPGGPGGPGGRGPGGFGGPPQPGQVLPAFLQEQLKLTAEQKKELEALQKDVETRLGKILTDDQKKQLKEMGPGSGRGRPGGPGGRGPGGPPPGGEGGRPERPE